MSVLNTILFYFFSALAVASALVMITRRNVAHAGIFLVTTLLATGGIFLLLQAEFTFALQIFLFAGGAVVLFVLASSVASSLASPQLTKRLPGSHRGRLVAAALGLVLAAQIGFAIVVGHTSLRLPAMQTARAPKNTEAVGDALLRQFTVPFEIASVLLLVSMIGAVVLARRRA
jgi:NADH-quinone oxidoreductase subunit J